MTRRAGGADSRPAPMEQSDRQDSTTAAPPPPHSTTPRRVYDEKRQIPARPSAARSTTQPAQSVPNRTAPHSAQHATRQTMKRDTHELLPHAGNPFDAPRSAREQYRTRREANPRTRYGGTRGHLGRGRPTHKRSIFKPGYCTHGLFIASAFGYPYSVAQ